MSHTEYHNNYSILLHCVCTLTFLHYFNTASPIMLVESFYYSSYFYIFIHIFHIYLLFYLLKFCFSLLLLLGLLNWHLDNCVTAG
jgi:hypothetical protein